ncbi:hypothetical protein LTSEHVI_3352, partial [Salmonella enterica subsp. enterica serovar Hvittingfoss str. A4-620]
CNSDASMLKTRFGCFFVACFKLSPHLALIHPAGTGI